MPADPVECPVCEFLNVPGSNYCSACGAELPASDEPTTATEPVPGVDVLGAGEEAKLIVIRGDQAGARFELRGPGDGPVVTSIGRHPDSDVFLDDITVSRRHAEITVDPLGQFSIRDTGSMNGTYVDGTQVTTAVIREGSQIQIGRFRLMLVVGTHGGEQ